MCGKMSAELAMQMYIEELKQVGAAEPVDGGGRGLNSREGVFFRSGWGGAWMTISKPGGGSGGDGARMTFSKPRGGVLQVRSMGDLFKAGRRWSTDDLFKAERGCPSGQEEMEHG